MNSSMILSATPRVEFGRPLRSLRMIRVIESLLAAQRVVDGLARVLLGPDPGQIARAVFIEAVVELRIRQPLCPLAKVAHALRILLDIGQPFRGIDRSIGADEKTSAELDAEVTQAQKECAHPAL